MEAAIPYHYIKTSEGLSLSVQLAVVAGNSAIDVVIEPLADERTEDDCPAETSAIEAKLPLPFEPFLLETRIRSLVEILLKADGQASHDLFNSRTVITRVLAAPPSPSPTVDESSTIEAYRSSRMSAVDLIRPILLAAPTLASLHPFQIEGVHWLTQRDRGILADDMGLGKTVQAISALRLLFNQGSVQSALIVCPKSLIANWDEELSRWAPELGKVRLVPKASIRWRAWQAVGAACHVVLTNYEQMRHPPVELTVRGVDIVIVDEAHRIRNIGSQVARGVRKIRSTRLWALTGTPVERDSEDLATILSLLEPSHFSISDKNLHPTSLRAQARPYILRRLKSQVLNELPAVWESRQTLELLPGQRASYEDILRQFAQSDSNNILQAINELRSICDFDERTGESVKLDRIMQILEDVALSGDKAVVFSYLLKPLDILQRRLEELLGKAAVLNLRGSMSSEERDKAITDFRKKDSVSTVLCSLRVAGEGLTLTEANHVIFVNEWWNPSSNAQARDRVVRIGQRKGVYVYKFKCKNTIEEELEDILNTKSANVAHLIDHLAEPGSYKEQLRPLLARLAMTR